MSEIEAPLPQAAVGYDVYEGDGRVLAFPTATDVQIIEEHLHVYSDQQVLGIYPIHSWSCCLRRDISVDQESR